MILKNKRLPVNASGGLLPMRPSYRRNTGFPSAYPVPKSTPFKDFGRGILDAFTYTPDPNKTFMERSFVPLAADMEAIISGFDAQGNKVPDPLRMMSLTMPGSTGLGGKAGLGILGAATGAVPKVGSAYASRLIPTLENMPQEKMSAEQFSGWLSKQQVGADELEYSGIPGLLAQGGDVTKTGLLNQARANPLDIQDVVLGAPPSYTYDKKRLAALENEYANLTEHAIDTPSFGEAKYDEMIKLMNIRDKSTTQSLYALAEEKMKAAQIAQRRGNNELAESLFRENEFLQTRAEKLDLESLGALPVPTVHSQWQLPGGENYREMLLTLPTKAKRRATQKELERGYAMNNQGAAVSVDSSGMVPDIASEFRSGHFNQPNVLAHARYNTRTIDGDKTLFIEEIQSDWHQKGRDVGYKTPENKAKLEALKAQRKKILEQRDADAPDWFDRYEELSRERELAYPDASQISEVKEAEFSKLSQQKAKFDAETKSLLADVDSQITSTISNVPDAPYKRTDKWAGLTLQRMVKEAVDSGHDRIAWTPGKVQAERYDLSKQLSEIHLSGSNFKAYGLDGEPVIQRTGVTPEDLPELIGKEAADRLMSQKPKAGLRSLIGENLQIGGEGMKEFYDKMLVKSANKFGKKYGAKAQKSKLEPLGVGSLFTAKTVWSMKITPEMKAGISKGVMLGQTGAEGKVAAGLLQSQNEQEQMRDNAPPIKSSLFGTMYGGGYI
tara:strand:- start:70 stop:2247 length:2178 start_codon:yes stop_codon:yes gene_type:complete